MDRTLILVKPDAFARGLTGEIIARFERKGLRIVALKHMVLAEDTAQSHYAEHEGKPFFDGLVAFITSGPIVAMVLEGPNAIAGEWGHNPLPLPREADLPLRACYCGRLGCIETYLSGPALERDQDLSLYEERLARSLAAVINLLDPDVIVLGGGMSKLERLYTEVPRLWTRYVFSDNVTTRLVPPAHGDASGVRGAAWLWSETPKEG